MVLDLESVAEEARSRAAEDRECAWVLYAAGRALADGISGGEEEASLRNRYLQWASEGAQRYPLWDRFTYVNRLRAQLLVQIGDRREAERVLEEALRVLPRTEPARTGLSVQLIELVLYRESWDEAHRRLDEAEITLAEADSKEPYRSTVAFQICGLRAQRFLRMGLLDQAGNWVVQEGELVDRLAEHNVDLSWAYAVHRADFQLAAEHWEELVESAKQELEGNPAVAARPEIQSALRVRMGVALTILERLDPTRPREAESLFESVLAQEPPAPDHERRTAEMRLLHLYLSEERLEDARRFATKVRGDLEARKRSESTGDRGSASPSGGTGSTLEDAHLVALEVRLDRLDRPASGTEPEGERSNEGCLRVLSAYESLLEVWAGLKLRQGGVGFLQTARVRVVLSELILQEKKRWGETEGTRRSLEELLRAQSLGSLARELECPPATLEAVRKELLGPEEGVLFYLPSRDVSHVFGFDKERLIHRRLVSRQFLEEQRKALLDRVMVSPYGLSEERRELRAREIAEIGTRLADMLFPGPIRELVESWSEVTIVSPDLLGYLPFECLPLGDGDLLGLRKAVGYLGSLPLGLTLAERARSSAKELKDLRRDCLVVGAPRHADGLPSPYSRLDVLPFGPVEKAGFLSAYEEGVSIDFLLDEEAHFEALSKEKLQSYRVAHFLVHGIHNYRFERTVGLLLSPGQGDNGLIWMDRLETLDPPDVVLMTACGTGRGPARRGDSGVANLGGVLLKKGAIAVVLPYAAVAYHPTIDLSSALHRFLKQGFGLAEAMRRARCEIAEKPGLDDPFYSSLLHVRGLPHFAPFARPEGEGIGLALGSRSGREERVESGSPSELGSGPEASGIARIGLGFFVSLLFVGGLVTIKAARIRARRRRRNQESERC